MKVEHSEVKILREALAHCANYGQGTVKERALRALKQYSMSVRLYCTHVDMAALQGKRICIDCGFTVREIGS